MEMLQVVNRIGCMLYTFDEVYYVFDEEIRAGTMLQKLSDSSTYIVWMVSKICDDLTLLYVEPLNG